MENLSFAHLVRTNDSEGWSPFSENMSTKCPWCWITTSNSCTLNIIKCQSRSTNLLKNSPSPASTVLHLQSERDMKNQKSACGMWFESGFQSVNFRDVQTHVSRELDAPWTCSSTSISAANSWDLRQQAHFAINDLLKVLLYVIFGVENTRAPASFTSLSTEVVIREVNYLYEKL